MKNKSFLFHTFRQFSYQSFRPFLALTLTLGLGITKNAFATDSAAFDHSHFRWTSVLKQHVVIQGPASKIRYQALSKNPDDLKAYLSDLSRVTKKQYDQFSKEQKLAFLINAYNAYTVKLIIDHYPVSSIKKIGSFFSSPWKIEFFSLLGEKMNLDRIEHQMLRKDFSEPRIHFAINCASIGCPALRAEAYTAPTLSTQLEEQTASFLADSNRNYLDLRQKKLTLSKIFDWFEEDFTKNNSTVDRFVAKFMTKSPAIQKEIESGDFSIIYSKYDWDLNESL